MNVEEIKALFDGLATVVGAIGFACWFYWLGKAMCDGK
jgi:hypothetical protein